MLKKLALCLSMALCFAAPANAEKWTLNQILETTCRVQAGDAYGSGSCIKYEDGKYWILSNAHVVGRNKTVYVEFFRNGRKTLPIPAKVEWRRLEDKTEIDFALLSVSENYFGKYPPRVATMAPTGAVAVGGYMVSAGCPGARWPSAWEGFLINSQEGRLLFYPPPLGGQSGSGLYIICKEKDEYQTYLKGVVTWRIEGGVETTSRGYENAHGGAASVDRLVDAIEGRTGNFYIPDTFQPVALPRILPRPNKDVPPEVQPEPAPSPNDNDGTNPYNNLPDFDEAPKVLPPVEEIEKVEEEKAKVEEEKASEMSISDIVAWVMGGLSTILTALGGYLYKAGKLKFKSEVQEKIVGLEQKLDGPQDKIFDRLEPVLGDSANKLREKIEFSEQALIDKLMERLDQRLGVLPKEITIEAEKTEDEDDSLLEEVTKNLINSVDVDKVKTKLKTKALDLLKGKK